MYVMLSAVFLVDSHKYKNTAVSNMANKNSIVFTEMNTFYT
jgi:hypothetical protein